MVKGILCTRNLTICLLGWHKAVAQCMGLNFTCTLNRNIFYKVLRSVPQDNSKLVEYRAESLAWWENPNLLSCGLCREAYIGRWVFPFLAESLCTQRNKHSECIIQPWIMNDLPPGSPVYTNTLCIIVKDASRVAYYPVWSTGTEYFSAPAVPWHWAFCTSPRKF